MSKASGISGTDYSWWRAESVESKPLTKQMLLDAAKIMAEYKPTYHPPIVSMAEFHEVKRIEALPSEEVTENDRLFLELISLRGGWY